MTSLLPSAPFSLTKVDFAGHADEIGALRIRSWQSELGIDPAYFARHLFTEPVDEVAHHWVIKQDDVVVGAARLSLHESIETVPYASLLPRHYWPQFAGKTIASFSRMVIDPEFRGHGFSTVFDRVRFELANEQHADFIVGATQLAFRRKALTNLGFSFICELHGAPERPDWPMYFMLYDAALAPAPHAFPAPTL
jgi:predicted GNAT family N-acyltransferase